MVCLVQAGQFNLDGISTLMQVANDATGKPLAGPTLQIKADVAHCPVFYHAQPAWQGVELVRDSHCSGRLEGCFSALSLCVSALKVCAWDWEETADWECGGRCKRDPVQLLCRFMRLLPESWQRLEIETPCAETPVQLSARKREIFRRFIPGERDDTTVRRFCSMAELTAGLLCVAGAEGVKVSSSGNGRSVTLTRCPQAGMQRTASLLHGSHVCELGSACSDGD